MPANPNQLGFYYNQDLCIGCRSCEAACKQENNVPVGVRRRIVRTFEGGDYPKPFRRFISWACNHCDDPACLNSCPTTPKAISKRAKDGVVLIDPAVCIGCKKCIDACPYGACQWEEETKKADKCTFNIQRIDQGLPPACVSTCPGHALQFGKISELEAKYGKEKELPGFPSPRLTRPNIRFTPARGVEEG